MSTRATVDFQQNGTTKAIVYRHCDGYPEGLGRDLRRFVDDLPAQSHYDPTFVAARFVRSQARLSEGGNVGIVLEDPDDIEYRYLVHCDGSEKPVVEVQSCRERQWEYSMSVLREKASPELCAEFERLHRLENVPEQPARQETT